LFLSKRFYEKEEAIVTRIAAQRLRLIFIFIVIIIAVIGFLVSNHSLAWFASNKEVTAEGMSLNVKVSSNLIISKTPEDITNEDVVFSVAFEGTARTDMIAVTHDSDAGDTNLKYLENLYAVDYNTGLANPGDTLDFEPVPETDNEPYFIDHVVYIASAFKALEVSSLSATVTISEPVDSVPLCFMAASVDFYVGEVSESAYRGTTSVADCIHQTERASVELFPDGTTVPLNTAENGYIKVIMRCYFDGALQDPQTGVAYVNSNTVRTDGVVIGVDFTAVDAETAE
jgi:hypothetical protein